MILGGSILAVALSSLAFVGLHFLLSHPLRAPLVRLLGEKGFPGVYSLIIAVAFAWLIYAHATAPYIAIWGDPVWARHLLPLIMIPSVLLVVLGLTSKNPTLGSKGASALVGAGHGVTAITRHPMLWGFALWAIGHMLANGDQATVILTAGILILSLGGAAAIDAKKSKSLGAPYQAFMARTSFVPFVAMAQGRAKLSLAEIGVARLGLAIVVDIVLVVMHPYIIGRTAIGM